MNDAPVPLTPLTTPDNLPEGQGIRQRIGAVLLWLLVSLAAFIGISFLLFLLFAGAGMMHPEAGFTLAVLCALPPALTISSLLAGRKLFYTISNRRPQDDDRSNLPDQDTH